MTLLEVVVLLLAYLFGSIPFSYLVPRLAADIDIRQAGTGNVGAHNVMHEVGRLPGLVAGILDAAKGAAAVLLAGAVGPHNLLAVLAGAAAVLGHNYPLWLSFRGGRGLATSIGIVLALMPAEALFALTVLAVLYLLITYNIAFSTLVSFLLLAVIARLLGRPITLVWAPVLLLILMAMRQAPELWQMWHTAEDKRDLILNKWIFDRDAKI